MISGNWEAFLELNPSERFIKCLIYARDRPICAQWHKETCGQENCHARKLHGVCKEDGSYCVLNCVLLEHEH